MKKEYPYIGEFNHYGIRGLRVRFTSACNGVVVDSGNSSYPVGHSVSSWAETYFKLVQGEIELANLKKDDIIIGSQNKTTGTVSFAANPKVQPNFLAAQAEAERLANADKTKKFVVCKVMGVCSANTTTWE